MKDLIWIEVNKANLKHNIDTFRKIVGDKVILSPCIKSNAYGHGLVGVGKIFMEAGADWLSVNSIFEAIKLREAGIKTPIIVIGYVQLEELEKVVDNDLKVVVYNRETIGKLSELAAKNNKKIDVHLKIDTGMARQGILINHVEDYIRDIYGMPSLNLDGVATHYASSDEPEAPEYFQKQLKRFSGLINELQKKDLCPKYVHSSNSGATLLNEDARHNLVRPGLSTYGYYPSEGTKKICLGKNILLKPTLSLKTKVAMVKTIPAGEGVSYGSTYITEKDIKVAVLPIGYYDGVDRKLSNQGEVLIGGKRARILGRVCMNIIIVDISDVPSVELEDEVVLIGKQGDDEISVEEWADKIGTINYEVTTRLRETIIREIV